VFGTSTREIAPLARGKVVISERQQMRTRVTYFVFRKFYDPDVAPAVPPCLRCFAEWLLAAEQALRGAAPRPPQPPPPDEFAADKDVVPAGQGKRRREWETVLGKGARFVVSRATHTGCATGPTIPPNGHPIRYCRNTHCPRLSARVWKISVELFHTRGARLPPRHRMGRRRGLRADCRHLRTPRSRSARHPLRSTPGATPTVASVAGTPSTTSGTARRTRAPTWRVKEGMVPPAVRLAFRAVLAAAAAVPARAATPAPRAEPWQVPALAARAWRPRRPRLVLGDDAPVTSWGRVRVQTYLKLVWHLF